VIDTNELETQVRSAIATDRLVPDSAIIAVSADEIGTVTLRGTVSSPLQSRAAAHAAHSVEQVLDVINEIKVRPLHRHDDAPDAQPQAGAGAKSRPDTESHPAEATQDRDLDDEVRRLQREARALKASEEHAEASISEELRREHWGQAPKDPPPWEKDDRSEP
jgi:hypothetical protein